MTSIDPAALDRTFALAAAQVRDGVAPWVVLGVADADRVVRLESFAPDGTSIGADTVCLLASITKPIIATVVMQLVAEGRLPLGEPITTVLPEAAAAGDPPFTPWHLLSHTSGLGDLEQDGLLVRGRSHADAVRDVLALPRLAAPGLTYRYATSTFDLLAALISRLDGRPYPEALRARLLAPLGMGDTTFDPRERLAERTVLPHAAPGAEAGVLADPIVDAFIGMAMPGAGLWSTAPDLLRFGRAMLRGGELDGVRVLPRPFVELMTREATGTIDQPGDPLAAGHYALGWGKPGPTSPASPTAFGHGGITGTDLWIDPAAGFVSVYLTGVWEYPAGPSEAILDTLYAALG